MKTDFLRVACALAAMVALFFSGSVQAQDIQLASATDMNSVLARLADLESRLAASNVAGGGGCGCDAPVCDDYCDDCCGCGGFVGGVELLYLKPFGVIGVYDDFDYTGGVRFWAGWQNDSGLGVRIRDFDYAQNIGGGLFIDVNAIDGEVYGSFDVARDWQLIVGGGVRYIDFDQFGLEFYGAGPVLTAELYGHLSDGAAVYAIARQSMVFGPSTFSENDTIAITELQIGAQVQREYNGGLLFARTGWEVQTYNDALETAVTTGLNGIAFSFGLMR